MARVLEINRIEQLDDYRHEWGRLLAETPAASFFQSLEWLESYWRHFGAGQKLRVLIVRDGDRPVGILPLVVRAEAS
jgi:CelD/BcsL family acetyltransferase involved in cellulose biosynthesis